MAVDLLNGRMTDAHQGEVVVFLIGMRINRLRAPRSWWPVVAAMPRMLKELAENPAAGLLGVRTVIGGGFRELTTIQYWRDQESLLAYASAADQQHRPAWQAFNRQARAAAAGGRSAVGIWHETYVVPAGRHETVYVDMPAFGLGAAAGVQPVAKRGDRAAQRLGEAG